MKSLQLDFNADGATLRLDKLVSGVAAELQNTLVNVGTSKGSDPLFENRGTDLIKEATRGAIVDLNSARHAANFAALYTLNFVRETLPASLNTSPDRIVKYKLSTAEFNGSKLSLQIQATTLDNRVIGIDADIQA